MSIISKTSVKSAFETGDRPSQTDFENFIDSSMRDTLIAIATAGEGGSTGLIEIAGTAAVSTLTRGSFGTIILATDSTASASTLFNLSTAATSPSGAIGLILLASETTASVQNQIGAGTIGIELLEAIVTASALGHLGAQTVGIQVLEASATSQLTGIISKLETEQSASGTAVSFTGIPSWVKRISIQFVGISTNGTSPIIIQIGDSGGFETSGYLGAASGIAGAVTTSLYTDGFGIYNTAGGAATDILHGRVVLELEDTANFTWVASVHLSKSDNAFTCNGSGSKSLTAALDRVRITTQGGTDTFDAGAFNILYE